MLLPVKWNIWEIAQLYFSLGYWCIFYQIGGRRCSTLISSFSCSVLWMNSTFSCPCFDFAVFVSLSLSYVSHNLKISSCQHSFKWYFTCIGYVRQVSFRYQLWNLFIYRMSSYWKSQVFDGRLWYRHKSEQCESLWDLKTRLCIFLIQQREKHIIIFLIVQWFTEQTMLLALNKKVCDYRT